MNPEVLGPIATAVLFAAMLIIGFLLAPRVYVIRRMELTEVRYGNLVWRR